MLFFTVSVHTTLAECTQPNKSHIDKNVTRCTYSQEDLNRMHKNLPERHENNHCSFCGCAKESHTTK